MSSPRHRWSLYFWLLLPLVGVVVAGALLLMGEREAVLHEARAAVQHVGPGVAAHLYDELGKVPWHAFPGLDKNGQVIRSGFLYADPPAPQPANEAQQWLAAGRSVDVLTKAPGALSMAGLPLAPLAAMQVLKNEKDPARMACRWQELASLATVKYPSALSRPLIEAGEALLRERAVDIDAACATAKSQTGRIWWKTPAGWRKQWNLDEETRAFMVSAAGSIQFVHDYEWMSSSTAHFLVIQFQRFGVRAPEPVLSIDGTYAVGGRQWGQEGMGMIVLPWAPLAQHLAQAVLNDPLLHELPRFTSLDVTLCRHTVFDNRGSQGVPELLDVSLSGDIRVAACLVNGPDFRAALARRLRWTGGALGLAFLVCAFGSWQTLRSYRRQEELNEQKSNFISSVSHELRAPLASLRLMSESLADGTVSDPERIAEYHALMNEESVRMSSLVNNVLHAARLERGIKDYHFEDCDPAQLIAGVTRVLSPRAERRGVRWEADVAAFDPLPQADCQALHQALLNLVDNALKHAPPDSIITLAAQPEGGREWSLSVADQGPGIAVAERGKVFEPFYRIGSELTRETPGTGLGLNLVQHIAQDHGGRVIIDEAPGGGARVTLYLSIKIA